MSNVIYVVEHVESGKRYVGKTIDPDRRWREHRNNSEHDENSTYLYNAIRKHGKEAFIFKIVETVECESELSDAEKRWIALYRLDGIELYNMTDGGDGQRRGWSPSDETRQKMSESHVGEKNSFYGKTHSNETRQKISQANKGRTSARLGMSCSNETKEKMRAAKLGKQSPLKGRKGTPNSQDRRTKISNSLKGRSKTDEHRRKIGLGNTGKVGSNKLTWEQVDKIRAMADYVSQKELALLFSVSPSAIMNIVNNKSWKK